MNLPYKVNRRIVFKDRSPTPEELTKVLDIGDIRDKVIISLLALGGLREGTLVQLKYRHVKKDLEKSQIPIHIHVENEITKGKYQDYDTFLGAEAAQHLRTYINSRIKGSRRLDPETITDESPLIRNGHSNQPKPISESGIYRIVHGLYVKAGLVGRTSMRSRHELRPHSIRKFFRTQMAALGVPTDYIEYMMGHTISTYHDVQMKGIEFLRNIYASSGLSIRPHTEWSKLDQVKAFMKSIGLNPEELLVKDAISKPHRTKIDLGQNELKQFQILGQALRKALVNGFKQS